MNNQNKTANALSTGALFTLQWATYLGAIMLSRLLITGCGGGKGNTGTTEASAAQSTSTNTGQLALALTDAEGDFLTYVVDVTSIELTRNDGAIIEALPITTSVDFAQYVEVNELLTMATVPAGTYNAIVLNLDYSNANVTVQADHGEPIAASLVDSDGNTLTELPVSLELANGSEFTIAPGVPAQVTLDFDLDASNEINITGNQATVIVEPVLLADTQFENPKSLRLRGLLESVEPAENLFILNIRPFRHRLGKFGSVRVHVTNATHYEIDGVVYDSQSGLAQLATLKAATPVIKQHGCKLL